VRPGNGPHQLSIELQSGGGWAPVASLPVTAPGSDQDCPTFASDPFGFFGRFLRLRGGNQTLRAVWQRQDGPALISEPVTVDPARRPGPLGSLLRPG
jgi:hypothetical protein